MKKSSKVVFNYLNKINAFEFLFITTSLYQRHLGLDILGLKTCDWEWMTRVQGEGHEFTPSHMFSTLKYRIQDIVDKD